MDNLPYHVYQLKVKDNSQLFRLMPSYFLKTEYRLCLHQKQQNQQPVQMIVPFSVSCHQRTKVYEE